MENGQKKILVIDDEILFRNYCTETLTRCGYSCKSADDPSDGLNQIKAGRFDLIILDILMEPFDGWETLDSIRTLRSVRAIPVMMISAKLLDVNEILRYGERIVGYIRKPVQENELCSFVRSFFAWQDDQNRRSVDLMAHGVAAAETREMTALACQVRVLNQLLENVSSRCLPEEGLSEEACLERRKAEIFALIQEKEALLRDTLHRIGKPA